jgi:hypothetical protein
VVAPTFVDFNETTSWFTAATSKTISVTVATGDVLTVIGGVGGNSPTLTGISNTGPALTWSLQQSIVAASFSQAYVWTSTAAGSSGAVVITVTAANTSDVWGAGALRHSGVSGIGASAQAHVASSTPSLNLTTTQDNSSLVVLSMDFNSLTTPAPTYLTTGVGTANQVALHRQASTLAAYGWYHADTGAAATETVGMSAPTGQTYSIVAVELKGSASAAAPAYPPQFGGQYHGFF